MSERLIRTFISVSVPKEIVNIQSMLKSTVEPKGVKVRWVMNGKMHLTLKFLGNITQGSIDNLNEALFNAVKSAKVINLSISGTGAFPVKGRPNVLWLGIKGDIDELKESQRILGKVPCHSWSQPETGVVLIAHHGKNDINLGSLGRPLHGVKIDIVDDQYNVVLPGSVGNLAIWPGWPAMFQTYWNDSNLYKSRFRKGWYISGEKAYIDDNGYVWLVR